MSNPQQPLLSLAADIGTALTCCDSVDDVIQHCAEALVRNLEAAFARIWVYDDSTRMLILRASAGLYTHVDGAHSRIALGALKIGQIAQDRQPHMTNEVWNDPRVSDKDWARETGMVAFAGHPLLVNDQLIGVMAMFSTKPLSETTTRALASVADGVALGIHRKQIEGRLREREQLFMQFANNMQDVLWLSRPHAQQTLWISPAVEQVMGVKPEDVYENPYAFMEVIIPEDRPRMAQFMEMTETLRADSPKKTTDVEYRIRKDGELRWLWTRAFPSFDGEGKIYQICGFTHDITEKKEAERRVSEFYSTVSHELRTPLTSIRAALGLIEGGVTHPDSTETVELISIARREADRLIRLINDILDMRKMEAGKLPLKILPLAPHVVVSNTVSAMRTFAQEHDVELVTWIQEERSFIGDYDRVVQVLTNLISNAIKFSPAGSLVNVNVQASFSERIRFAVSDEGPGIPPEQYNKLFGIFQQLDQSDSRSRGGTGLGLAISKAIVERLNGVIGFDSELGKGSTFWFELPFLAESWSPAEEPAGGSTADKHSPALLEFIQEYGKTLPKRLLSLEKCIRDAKVSERPIAVKDCLNEVRKIRASSEPCGFPEVAAAMAKLEQSLTSIINKEGDPEQEWKEILLCCARITEVSKSQYAQDR